jgi:FAD/FMN-containing dehydrogenase
MDSITKDLLQLRLIEALGAKAVRCDADTLDAHAGDWSEIERLRPGLVVFPSTPEQVALALGLITQAGHKVVVQGGLTGLAGGATPQADEVAISLSRLDRIEHCDLLGGTATVQAGITLEALNSQMEHEGWMFPLDLGARGSCQLGGNAATNAGGNKVIRYGTVRGLVLGIEVALPNGTLLTMLNEVTKNTTGLDLKQLFIGSEGTLGIITRLSLKLSPVARMNQTALCALESFDQAAALLKDLRASFPGLSAFELMWDSFMQAAAEASHSTLPFSERHALYALIEIQGANDALDREALEQFLGDALEREQVKDAVIAASLSDAQRLWLQRESIAELLSLMKPAAAFDIGLPLSEMDAFVRTTQDKLATAFGQQKHLFFGHLGDGNLHVLSGPYPSESERHAVEALVYEGVRQARGCISAEHGIGVLKQSFLHLSRSDEELAIMRQIKALFDPNNLLNSNRVF